MTTTRSTGFIRATSGCKVGWEFYETLADAQARIEDAKQLAELKAAEGHDYGYLVPGQITECHDGTWRITVP